MRILILGGTHFLGRHFVDAALAGGHEVILLHRGQTNDDLFPTVEHLHTDRDSTLEVLGNRSFDAIVDTSGFIPRIVRSNAAVLSDRAAHYTFVSSMSVYAASRRSGLDETARLATLPRGASEEELTGETYGALKVLCERAVEESFSGRTFIVRPGLIVGPHDPTDRFPYWPRRLARDGDVLAPGRPEAPVQIIDARDLAEWMLRRIEARATGVFNASGPERTLTMGQALGRMSAAVGSDARLVWVPDDFLLEQEVVAYSEMPLWIPAAHEGFNAFDCRRAFAAGLTCRPLEETARDTLAWDRATGPRPHGPRKPGVLIPPSMTPERETALLAAWRERQTAGEERTVSG